MCVSNSWYNPTTTKRVTVTEREYDDNGNLVKEVETITETETKNEYYNPLQPPYITY